MSEKIEIEKGIDMPERYRGKGDARSKYPFDEMEIGDSFLIPLGIKSGSGYACFASKRYSPKRFTSRKTSDGCYRVWRIE